MPRSGLVEIIEAKPEPAAEPNPVADFFRNIFGGRKRPPDAGLLPKKDQPEGDEEGTRQPANGDRTARDFIDARAPYDPQQTALLRKAAAQIDEQHYKDAVEMLQKYVARVCHVHCKDVRPSVIAMARNRDWSFLEAVINGAFTVPGDGSVDFRNVVETLRRHGYSGWLVVEAEQDPVVAPAYRYAELGFRYLSRLVRNGAGAN